MDEQYSTVPEWYWPIRQGIVLTSEGLGFAADRTVEVAENSPADLDLPSGRTTQTTMLTFDPYSLQDLYFAADCTVEAADNSLTPPDLPSGRTTQTTMLTFDPYSLQDLYFAADCTVEAADNGLTPPDLSSGHITQTTMLAFGPYSPKIAESQFAPRYSSRTFSTPEAQTAVSEPGMEVGQARALVRPAPPESKPACMRCRANRKQCHGRGDRCGPCIVSAVPRQLCCRPPLTDMIPFQKWLNNEYVEVLIDVQKINMYSTKAVRLSHNMGAILQVECCSFAPLHKNQYRVLLKDAYGFHSQLTSAYCLKQPVHIDVRTYVDNCLAHAVRGCHDPFIVQVLRIASPYEHVDVIRNCLRLFTCLRLLRVGWQFAGAETLEMSIVTAPASPFFGVTPVPRMVANQLNHSIEVYMVDLENIILGWLERCRSKDDWVIQILAVFFILHVREVDAGRNIYWSRHKDPDGYWIHPSKPADIIEQATHSCNQLISHFHFRIKDSPLSWNTEQYSGTATNRFLTSVKQLQALRLSLSL